jgi:hypothetical protein
VHVIAFYEWCALKLTKASHRETRRRRNAFALTKVKSRRGPSIDQCERHSHSCISTNIADPTAWEVAARAEFSRSPSSHAKEMSLLYFSNAGQLWGLVFSFADLNRFHGSAAKPNNKPFKNNGGPSSNDPAATPLLLTDQTVVRSLPSRNISIDGPW